MNIYSESLSEKLIQIVLSSYKLFFIFTRREKKRLHNDNMLNISTPHVNLLTLYLEREDEEEMAKFLFVKFVVFIHNTAQHYAM